MRQSTSENKSVIRKQRQRGLVSMGIQKWVFTSDTHAPVTADKIPPGDVLVHAGDLQSDGDKEEFKQCLAWLGQTPHASKFLIPGNHDFYLDQYPGPALQACRRAGVTVVGMPNNLEYETRTLDNGLVLGGMPLVRGLHNRWAFGESTYGYANPEQYGMVGGDGFQERLKRVIIEKIKELLEQCDILITHAPMRGQLDQDQMGGHRGDAWFREALDAIQHRRTQLWVHGHMHESVGYATTKGVREDPKTRPLQVCNVAMCDRSNRHAYRPTVFEYSKEEGFVCKVRPGTRFLNPTLGGSNLWVNQTFG